MVKSHYPSIRRLPGVKGIMNDVNEDDGDNDLIINRKDGD